MSQKTTTIQKGYLELQMHFALMRLTMSPMHQAHPVAVRKKRIGGLATAIQRTATPWWLRRPMTWPLSQSAVWLDPEKLGLSRSRPRAPLQTLPWSPRRQPAPDQTTSSLFFWPGRMRAYLSMVITPPSARQIRKKKKKRMMKKKKKKRDI